MPGGGCGAFYFGRRWQPWLPARFTSDGVSQAATAEGTKRQIRVSKKAKVLSKAGTLRVSQLAANRSRHLILHEMRAGLNCLATIASTAAFLGLFGTILGILGSFGGCGGEKSMCMAALAQGLSNALIPAALGLMVALLALASHSHFRAEVKMFNQEMSAAILEMENRLAALS